jgi:hypothetical protein
MKITHILSDVDPRRDDVYIQALIQQYLNMCDPDDRVTVTLEIKLPE